MADLLAYQFDDADDGEAAAKTREDRKRRAFLDSKTSYPEEPVVILPGWFIESVDNLEIFSAERDAKDVVLAVQHLYLHREYDRALKISLAVMNRMDAVDTSGRKASSHSRELQDLALRSAIQTNQGEVAAYIADQTRARWEAMPGSAASAGEAYLLVNRARDAISALLIAVKNRPHLYRYILALAQAFEILQDPPGESKVPSSGRSTSSVVRSLRAAAKRGAAFEDLGSSPWPRDCEPVGDLSTTGGPVEESVSETEIASCLQSFGLSDHTDQIIELCTYVRGTREATLDELDTPRSVRSL